MKRPSTRTSIAVLLAANLLAGGALLVSGAATAQPQSGTGQPASVRPLETRARGDYTMVSGRIGAGGTNVVYVVDSANQEVMALRWDNNKQIMLGVGYRSLANDGRGARGR